MKQEILVVMLEARHFSDGRFTNNYYNLFVDSVSVINEVDYDTLNMIINVLEKWILWIEENYISNDKDGYYVYKIYIYKDMVESGLMDELDLADFQR